MKKTPKHPVVTATIVWDDDMLDGFDKLVELVRTASKLNRANNCTDNILRAIELAEALDHTDLGQRKFSFLSRLGELRRPPAETIGGIVFDGATPLVNTTAGRKMPPPPGTTN